MDKQLQGIHSVPVDKGNLIKTRSSAKSFSAFLFEPKDLVPFKRAWDWQKNWQKGLLAQEISEQAVWLLEHPSCYTLGRGATQDNLLFDSKNPPSDLFRIDRGGEVTCHMPGQLVVYPVLDLRFYQTDLNWYLRELEQVLIDVLRLLGLSGERLSGLTGVWLAGKKVASIGVGCRRWITQHGFALNVDCELFSFESIIPCGLKEVKVGRLTDWLPGLSIKDVRPLVLKVLAQHFQLVWINE